MLTRPTASGLFRIALAVASIAALGVAIDAQGPRRVPMGDWPELRGPTRDGRSPETGLPERWALNGENFLWRAPYGGRSTPLVAGNRVFVQNPKGHGEDLQERVMALDADTGKVLWEYTFSNFQSDVPPHRLAWATPAVDPDTGNVYAFGSGGMMLALSRDGKLLWHRSIGEEFAAFTTHGGRTPSPLIDGDLVIVSHALSNWGEFGNRQHRFVAMDKRTGDVRYVASPGGRPYDTAYAPPLITTIGGTRLLIQGLGDGGVYAIKPQTGERVWGFVAAKRGINTGVVAQDNKVFVSHGDENVDQPTLGMVAALDGSATGDIAAPIWANKGIEFLFSSPVVDGSTLYILDTGAKLFAFDTGTGKELWEKPIAISGQQASLVLADGKLYVGTSNGKFFIIRPSRTGAEVLSEVTLPDSTNSCCSSEGVPEQVLAGAAVSRGRVFFQSVDAIYAIGPKAAKTPSGYAVDEAAVTGQGEPAWVQVVPTELMLRPGESATLRARLFDARGRYLRDATDVSWSLEGLQGTIANGTLTIAGAQIDQAGLIKATAGSLSGHARARVSRALPWTETFAGYDEGATPPGWTSMGAGQFAVATLDGQKALQKKPVNTLFKRIRAFYGPTTLSNYTVQADIQAPTRRRQQGDVGITAQTYSLVLYGTHQKLKLESWEPETERTVTTDFDWPADTWQTLKLRVENLPDGQVKIQGKAWRTGTPEPGPWTIEKVDPIGNREGAPGFFIDAEFGAFIDNLQVTPNGGAAGK